MTTATKVPARKAATQKEAKPRNCTGCNHSASFHRSGPCKVMACVCQTWDGPLVPRKPKKK